MDKECYRLNSQKEKLEEARESQNAYMWQEYEITPVRALEYRMEELPERGEMKRQIAEAKEAIRKLDRSMSMPLRNTRSSGSAMNS